MEPHAELVEGQRQPDGIQDGGDGSRPSPGAGEQEPTGDGMGYRSMGGMPGPDELAGCMGLSVEEYQDLTDPTHGEPRQPSKEEMQRQ